MLAFVDSLRFLYGEENRSDSDVDSAESSVNIENISIHTDHLDNTQDFSAAGNALAREFAKVIQERGLNVNAKK
jgi:hypothetical protein